MSDLFVEPSELRGAVSEVAAATSALEAARGALARAGELASSGIDHADRAEDKVSTFVRQWRSEYEIIGGFLGAFQQILTQAADCYEGVDDELAACIAGAGSGRGG